MTDAGGTSATAQVHLQRLRAFIRRELQAVLACEEVSIPCTIVEYDLDVRGSRGVLAGGTGGTSTNASGRGEGGGGSGGSGGGGSGGSCASRVGDAAMPHTQDILFERTPLFLRELEVFHALRGSVAAFDTTVKYVRASGPSGRAGRGGGPARGAPPQDSSRAPQCFPLGLSTATAATELQHRVAREAVVSAAKGCTSGSPRDNDDVVLVEVLPAAAPASVPGPAPAPAPAPAPSVIFIDGSDEDGDAGWVAEGQRGGAGSSSDGEEDYDAALARHSAKRRRG